MVDSHPVSDASRAVAEGYDAIAARYLAWSSNAPVRLRYLDLLLELLPESADVLELGCGAGEPVTRRLAERHRVMAVDVSAAQLELAAQNAPGAQLILADMADASFAPGSFDAVASFYALTHVPRERHADLIARIVSWLRPRGLVVLTMGSSDNPGAIDPDWLGTPMYFSHFDAPTNRALVQRSGVRLISAEVVDEGERDPGARFLWVVGRRD
ncbi:MAG: class I SAM-dependent methyltransferase [Chloroflexota bacterium]|nr:class I SAM-dependent methyltransferase [Chloroflexota bacterium]